MVKKILLTIDDELHQRLEKYAKYLAYDKVQTFILFICQTFCLESLKGVEVKDCFSDEALGFKSMPNP